MQTLDPPVVSALAALCAATLMAYAGVGKGLLSWWRDAVRRRAAAEAAPPRQELDLGRPALSAGRPVRGG